MAPEMTTWRSQIAAFPAPSCVDCRVCGVSESFQSAGFARSLPWPADKTANRFCVDDCSDIPKTVGVLYRIFGDPFGDSLPVELVRWHH